MNIGEDVIRMLDRDRRDRTRRSPSACTGIKRYSFKGLEEKISEIYIPANIVYIEQGVFDDLPNLIYIEAQQGNAGYYSVNGILYYRDGKVAACPNRQRNQ